MSTAPWGPRKGIGTAALGMLFLFFLMPSAWNLPGKIYRGVFGIRLSGLDTEWQAVMLPTILVPLVILYLRLRNEGGEFLAPRKPFSWTAYSIVMVFIAGTLSALVHYDTKWVVLNYIAIYPSLLLVYFSCRRMEMGTHLYRVVIVVFSAGVLFPLLLGLFAYVQEWGVPDLQTLVLSRYDLSRMASYNDATFGITPNFAALLAMWTPLVLALVLDDGLGWRMRSLALVVLSLLVCHLLIVESRAGFLAVAVAVTVVLLFYGKGKTLLATVLILLLSPFALGQTGVEAYRLFADRLVTVVQADAWADTSVADREAAMKAGIRDFRENWIAGIGPGINLYANPFTGAHQFLISQASELGVPGLLSTVSLLAALFVRVGKIFRGGRLDVSNRRRFALLIGPATYFLFGILGGVTLNISFVNSFICLAVAFLALSEFEQAGMDLPRHTSLDSSA